MSYYCKEIEEILRDRSNNAQYYKSPSPPRVDSFMQFFDKGVEETSIFFGPVEDCCRQKLNLKRCLDHDGHPAITMAQAVAESGVPPWNWRKNPRNDGDCQSYGGRFISVKWGDNTRMIEINGTAEATKETIKSAFRFRTKRAFWLEDKNQIIRSLDKGMPLGNYTFHVDEVHTEEKIFYTEDNYHDFLTRRGWTYLRELDGLRNIFNVDDLRPGAIYHGVT